MVKVAGCSTGRSCGLCALQQFVDEVGGAVGEHRAVGVIARRPTAFTKGYSANKLGSLWLLVRPISAARWTLKINSTVVTTAWTPAFWPASKPGARSGRSRRPRAPAIRCRAIFPAACSATIWPREMRIDRIGQHQCARQGRDRLLQKLQPFDHHQRRKTGRAGDVPFWPRQVGHQPGALGIAQVSASRWGSSSSPASRPPSRASSRSRSRRRCRRTQSGGDCGKMLGLAVRRQPVEGETRAVDVAQFAQPIEERCVPTGTRADGIEGEEAQAGEGGPRSVSRPVPGRHLRPATDR